MEILCMVFGNLIGAALIWIVSNIPKKKIIQRTWCFCPLCKVDLCSNDSLIHNGVEVIYKCKGCGNVSWWNFDIAPFPVLMDSDEGSSSIVFAQSAPKSTESTKQSEAVELPFSHPEEDKEE